MCPNCIDGLKSIGVKDTGRVMRVSAVSTAALVGLYMARNKSLFKRVLYPLLTGSVVWGVMVFPNRKKRDEISRIMELELAKNFPREDFKKFPKEKAKYLPRFMRNQYEKMLREEEEKAKNVDTGTKDETPKTEPEVSRKDEIPKTKVSTTDEGSIVADKSQDDGNTTAKDS